MEDHNKHLVEEINQAEFLQEICKTTPQITNRSASIAREARGHARNAPARGVCASHPIGADIS